MYLQETGQAGREGKKAIAILHNISSQYHIDDLMRQYIKTKQNVEEHSYYMQHFDKMNC